MSVPVDVSRSRWTQVGFVVLEGYVLRLDEVEERYWEYEDQGIEARWWWWWCSDTSHVQKVNVNTSIAWATVFCTGVRVTGTGVLSAGGPHRNRIDKRQ